jgi:hypothetical protein
MSEDSRNIRDIKNEFDDFSSVKGIYTDYEIEAIRYMINRIEKMEKFMIDHCMWYGGCCGDGMNCPCDDFAFRRIPFNV